MGLELSLSLLFVNETMSHKKPKYCESCGRKMVVHVKREALKVPGMYICTLRMPK